MATTTSIVTMRLENTLIERIDKSAKRAGLTRTEYIRQWLPDAYADPRITNDAPRPSEPARTDEAGRFSNTRR
jgi:hypothetical protein